MQIVIDISAEDFEKVKYGRGAVSMMRKAIQRGIPLPKGHGRLIDADAFITKLEDVSKKQKYKEISINNHLTVDDVFKAVIESLKNEGLAEGDAPTILEADKDYEQKQKDEEIRVGDEVYIIGKCDCPKEEIEECLRIAIKALEQEPCEDAISRKALIERINQAEENFKADNIESISSGGDPFVDGVLSGVFNIKQMVAQAPSIAKALEQESKTDTWSIKEVADSLEKHGLIKEQEPCEDAISRQAVLDIAKTSKSNWIDNSVLFKKVNNLPPVTPQPKTVLYSGDGYADGYMVYDMAECPNCGYEYEEDDKDWKLPFCPNCGQALNWESEDGE